MKREIIDLSHFSFVAGDIGRLQTVAQIPLIAGDSVQLNYNSVMRLSALRRDLTLDAIVDMFAFFVPYRQIYGDDWINFIRQGTDETITFTNGPTVTTPPPFYLGYRPVAAETHPLHTIAGYNRIWNRFFRVPTDLANIRADAYIVAGTQGRKYGELCARLKTPWTTGIDETTDTSDTEVAAASSTLDILDLVAIQKRYQSEIERDYFAQRYTDVLSKVWGGSAKADADERPYLIMRRTQSLSGYDIDGTDDASLGTFLGKSVGIMQMNMPYRFFPEHGTLWIMVLVRFPTINGKEAHYLSNRNNPTYKEISGDPILWSAEPPAEIQPNHYFTDTSTADLGNGPYGNWYRHHPNFVHPQFTALSGFPISNNAPTTKDVARYFINNEFGASFQTSQLGQWNSRARIQIMAKRPIIAARRSIFAGT